MKSCIPVVRTYSIIGTHYFAGMIYHNFVVLFSNELHHVTLPPYVDDYLPLQYHAIRSGYSLALIACDVLQYIYSFPHTASYIALV